MTGRIFAVTRSHGPAWHNARSIEEQDGWSAHAAFMDALHAEGFVALVGPLEGTTDALLIARADNAAKSEPDCPMTPGRSREPCR